MVGHGLARGDVFHAEFVNFELYGIDVTFVLKFENGIVRRYRAKRDVRELGHVSGLGIFVGPKTRAGRDAHIKAIEANMREVLRIEDQIAVAPGDGDTLDGHNGALALGVLREGEADGFRDAAGVGKVVAMEVLKGDLGFEGLLHGGNEDMLGIGPMRCDKNDCKGASRKEATKDKS